MAAACPSAWSAATSSLLSSLARASLTASAIPRVLPGWLVFRRAGSSFSGADAEDKPVLQVGRQIAFLDRAVDELSTWGLSASSRLIATYATISTEAIKIMEQEHLMGELRFFTKVSRESGDPGNGSGCEGQVLFHDGEKPGG